MPAVPYVRATHVDGQSWSAAKANLLEAGCNDLSYAPAVHVTHNAGQSITNNTLTTLAFNTERFDQAGNAADTMHDTVTNNSRLTCRYAGVYQITANVQWAANATGMREVYIRHQNTTDIAKSSQTNSGVNTFCLNVTVLYVLAVNEYVECRVFQNSGGALSIDQVSNISPEFMMVRVG